MKYSEDIKMEIAGKFINGNYTDNLKLIYKDLNRLTKSAISEQLTLTDVVRQSEQLCEGLHSTDFNGKCFKCGEQVFVREPK